MPDIRLLFSTINLFKNLFETYMPKGIKIIENIKVMIEVREISRPVTLAASPRAKLLMVSASDKAMDSLSSIEPDLSVSAISGNLSISLG